MPSEELSPSEVTDFRRYRIGVVVVDNDPIPEMEINWLAPAGVSIHVVRFQLPRAAGEEFVGETTDPSEIGPHLMDPLRTLARIGVDAVGLCFTSSSIFNPAHFDDAFIEAALSMDPEWKVTTAARAIISTMKRAHAHRPHVVIPPWFTPPTVQALGAYLQFHGLAMSGSHQYELPAIWDRYPRQDRFDHGAKWAVLPHELAMDLQTRDLASSDSILIPGSGFPSLDLLHEVPAHSPLPMFTANSAVLEELLHQNDINIKEHS
jgi:maleate cis-trans isomerase